MFDDKVDRRINHLVLNLGLILASTSICTISIGLIVNRRIVHRRLAILGLSVHVRAPADYILNFHDVNKGGAKVVEVVSLGSAPWLISMSTLSA